jgi:hypothetical protein
MFIVLENRASFICAGEVEAAHTHETVVKF